MRAVDAGPLGFVSALGFGCASLGSRISERNGRAAIDRALKAGITWFDVAPSYGDGQAERILGDALHGTNAQIATKVGLVAHGGNPMRRLAGAVARPIVGAVPALRHLVKSLRGSAAVSIPLEAETIRESLFRSLERLKRDHVAMLALHGPSLDDVQADTIIEAMGDVLDQGLVKQVGIAGSVEAFAAARTAGMPATIAQIANDPFDRALERLPQPRPFTITHSVFGVSGALDALSAAMDNPTTRVRLGAVGYRDPAALLLDYAFAANPGGVVLASSYNAAHLMMNTAAASVPPDPALVARVHDALSAMRRVG